MATSPRRWAADKGYDDGEFFQALEEREIEPHVPWCEPQRIRKKVQGKKRLHAFVQGAGMKRPHGHGGRTV